ncbi:translation initiation factor IF-2 [Microscilla marina]|uniref:Translation initiation factor IF-2 n=1 Tax=Microscilla marina ATCC 23134 TaxID=313606 RepID=A1ZEG1_MICM2|nr:translation initiation factor IF-2 [Microscilla marina]EAY31469.1 translation initiation factor IF-2 [Microscilla marina ATCC 23134]
MADKNTIKLSQAAKKLNVGISTIAEVLISKGVKVETKPKPSTKISVDALKILANEFNVPLNNLIEEKPTSSKKENVAAKQENKKEKVKTPDTAASAENKKTKVETNPNEGKTKTNTPPKTVETKNSDTADNKQSSSKLPGLTVKGKIDLEGNAQQKGKANQKNKPKNSGTSNKEVHKKNTSDKAKATNDGKPAPEEKTVSSNIQKSKDPIKPKEEKPRAQTEKTVERPSTNVQKTPVDKNKDKSKEKVEKPAAKNAQAKESSATTSGKADTEKKPEVEVIKAKAEQLSGLTIKGKIELPVEKPKKKGKPVASSDEKRKKKKKKLVRNRKVGQNSSDGNKQGGTNNNQGGGNRQGGNNQNRNQGGGNRQGGNNQNRSQGGGNQNRSQGGGNRNSNNQSRNRKDRRNKGKGNNDPQKTEISAKQIRDRLKATMAQVQGSGTGSSGSTRSKIKAQKRAKRKEAEGQEEETTKILKVTEFISANDMASLMDVSVNEVISTCLNLGMFVSINQRLDAEAIKFIALEFDYDDVDFISTEEDVKMEEEETPDRVEDLSERAPIVTIMGHVDHGKTSLLDYVRSSNVTDSESGGITQHIGAYDVVTDGGKRIAFLDTPGHEAFTAMRARGAKLTDVVILVVAADDRVMPQTKEAINHAKNADVPIVIAINKVDKETANPDKIREELSSQGVLVESWGGKFQDQEISAKTGAGIPELLEKVLLEAELLELKANPDKNASGTVVEASLDKGKGYVTTVLVQAGTMEVGDVILAGSHHGRVKAMTDHLGRRLQKVGPSTPVQVLGLNGAPQSGDLLKVMENEREAREIANKREQIQRAQKVRATRGKTLEDIGREIALGNFQELKIIVKGDVDGSVEALSDSLLKLSTEEIAVRVIHKAVGGISEADVQLAIASEAIIIGFQVRPFNTAKRLAEQEGVQIKLYSIIYNAINDVKDAMVGMLAPKFEEVIVGNVEIRETFKISKMGTIAGCYVLDGYMKRNNKIRLIRDQIVKYEGELGSLKRFKDDVQEVRAGYECGLSVKNFNDILVGDIIESFEQREIKRTLK